MCQFAIENNVKIQIQKCDTIWRGGFSKNMLKKRLIFKMEYHKIYNRTKGWR